MYRKNIRCHLRECREVFFVVKVPPEQIDWKSGCRLGDIDVEFVFDLTANSRLVEESFKEYPLARGGCKVRLIDQILVKRNRTSTAFCPSF
jgi:hypothetical protein